MTTSPHLRTRPDHARLAGAVGPAVSALHDPAAVERLAADLRAAFDAAQWASALEGAERLHECLGDAAPRAVFAMGSTSLHRLGRFEEAERWAMAGLGPDRALIAVPGSDELPPESALIAGWGGRSEPVLSVVCTTFNHERYIDTAMRGFLSQRTSFPFEILVHDDASTDRTAAIVTAWQQRYPGLVRTVLQTENQLSRGVRPFELLMAQARGAYVATCEGDDFWTDATKLQRQVDFLESHADFSCTAHNYHHYVEPALTVSPWLKTRQDRVLSPRELMAIRRLLWIPTLVFRRTFTKLPPERSLSPIGDQFLTAYLGTFGACMYFESFLGAVRRENDYSTWSPLDDGAKEHVRVRTWLAVLRMHARTGNRQGVEDIAAKIAASPLDKATKTALFGEAMAWQPSHAAAA
jgi:glycosyltransferase involved in cell wall biosynthesis